MLYFILIEGGIINPFAGTKVLGSFDEAFSLIGNVFSKFSFLSFLDIIIVAALFYWLYTLIKETRAVQIMYGIVLLALIYLVARILYLNTLNFILQYALVAIIVAIPVVFQPELRNALVKLGQTKLTNRFIDLRKRGLETVIEEIVESSEILSKQKMGAIIVLARYDKLKDLVERGKVLDARLSTELILNIFTPKAPLHDGAIVISGSTIKAAGVILPLSESKFNYHLGTRHRAAIGLSSVTDAIVIVISGETGQIAIAIEGILESPLKSDELKKQLYALLRPNIKKEKPLVS